MKNEGKIWACLSYWGVIPILIAFFLGRKYDLVRYHLKQSMALIMFKNLAAVVLMLMIEMDNHNFGNLGLLILFGTLILTLSIIGTYHASQGKFSPLPVFGAPFGNFIGKMCNRIYRSIRAEIASI